MKKKTKVRKKDIIIISVIFIFFLFLIALKLSFKFEIKGKDKVEINYLEKYEEQGAYLSIFGKDKSDSIKTKNNVKEGKIGTYNVSYKVKLGILELTKTKLVKIVDDILPEIELTGEKEINICPDTEYDEEGYKSIDEYDGDLTADVKVSRKDNKIVYEVQDKSGNKKTVDRTLNYVDQEKPNINLKGNGIIYLPINSKYEEAGYEVTDNCSKDLNNSVKSENNIDLTKSGNYEVVYKVKDKLNNEAVKTRKVYVYDPANYNTTNIGGIIYLTFDDGPSGSGTTSKILDVLKDEGILATFFVTGSGPDGLIKRAYQEGHAIALHTYSHNFKEIYSSADNFFKDIDKIQNRVYEITGKKSNILRFAGGTNNTVSRKYKQGVMTEILKQSQEKGYKIFDWNVDSNDAGNCSKSSVSDKKSCVYKYVTSNLSKSRVNYVLMHDIKTYTADSIRDIIRYGKNNGYIFDILTENMNSYTFKPKN